MLRHPPSKVSLNATEVDQLKHRLKRRQNVHPDVAQIDWAAVYENRATQNVRPHPLPHIPFCFRRGPQRSYDDIVIHSNRLRLIRAQPMHFESTGNEEDNGCTFPSTFQAPPMLQEVEVHPTITQVAGYDPPAALIISPEQSPNRPDPNFSVNTRARLTQPELRTRSPFHTRHEPRDSSQDTQSLRPDQVPHRRGGWENPNFEDSEIDIGSLTLEPLRDASSLDPQALAFVPRVRFGTVTEEFAHRLSSHSSDRNSSNERLKVKSASSRNSDPRGHASNPTRSIPHPRAPVQGRQPIRVAHRFPSAISIRPRSDQMELPVTVPLPAIVQDRYPVFSPSIQEPSVHSRREVLPRREAKFRERQTGYCQQISVRPSRAPASKSSLSTPNLALPSEGPPVHSRHSSLTWDRQASPSRTPSSTATMGPQSAVSALRRGEDPKNPWEGFPDFSPLDDLIYELGRASTAFSPEAGSSPTMSSQTKKTHSRLLSGNVFDSDDSDDLEEEADAPLPRPRFLADKERQDSVLEAKHSYRDSEAHTPMRVSFKDQSDLSLEPQPRPQTVETAMVLASSRPHPVSLGPSSLSSFTSPDEDGDSMHQVPTTPLRLPPANLRKAMAPTSHNRSSATPKIKVYDDEQPPNTQPRTPADLVRNCGGQRRLYSPIGSSCRSTPQSAGISHPEYSPLIPPRNTHRNTYPSSNTSRPITYERYIENTNFESPGLPLRNAAAASAVARRRAARPASGEQENEFDPEAIGMTVEREIWNDRRNGVDTTLDVTPPREGRYERYLNDTR